MSMLPSCGQFKSRLNTVVQNPTVQVLIFNDLRIPISAKMHRGISIRQITYLKSLMRRMWQLRTTDTAQAYFFRSTRQGRNVTDPFLSTKYKKISGNIYNRSSRGKERDFAQI